MACGSIFTTLEAIDWPSILRVDKGAGQLVPFDRATLFVSIYESCKHRPNAVTESENLTQQILRQALLAQTDRGMVTRDKIVAICLGVLRPFDATAAGLYEAHHPVPSPRLTS